MRIVIVDDDSFVAHSLNTILSSEVDIEVVGMGSDGAEAQALYEDLQPDILLLDIQMLDTNGLDAAEVILAQHHNARIVFLTTFADEEYLASALKMGAKGYLVKQEVSTIAPALRSVLAGQSVIGNEVLEHMGSLINRGAEKPLAYKQQGKERSSATELSVLSEREYEIFELVAKGFDNKEIASTLYISEGTVRNYVSTILTKLELKNRTQLAVLYYQV
ncbi:MAG: response regulator transcription factor [Coriobacteriia bacterium]|nr:response regulator transcription factor [Coriobacteriia bacterium]